MNEVSFIGEVSGKIGKFEIVAGGVSSDACVDG